jgi:hypothetical protein
MKPIRIQRKRVKGWRMPPNTVSVTRPGKWGNPFKLTPDGWILFYKSNKIFGSPWCYWSVCGGFSTEDIVSLYKQWITGKLPQWLPLIPNISELKGKNLACFCPISSPCHGDILLELSNLPNGNNK